MSRVALISNAAVSTPAGVHFDGGKCYFLAQGTFGGTTCKLQILGPDGTNYVDIPTASFTAAGALAFDLPSGTYKAILTGGTPSAFYAHLWRA